MTKKSNGFHDDDQEKLVQFPSLAERDRLRREKEERDQTSGARRRPVPFFNFSKIPPFTGALIIAFLAVHIFLHLFLSPPQLYDVFETFGFTPAFYTGIRPLTWQAALAPITHLFIHGDWMHLFFNGTMALAMGIAFEREFGARTAAFFFFACGLTGALVYFLCSPHSTAPVIGASASLSGYFGAMIIIFSQRLRIASKHGPWPLIAFWIIFMVGMGVAGQAALAWQAHIGGFLTGIGLLYLMQKRRRFH